MYVEALLFLATGLAIAFIVVMLTGSQPSYMGSNALYDLSSENTVLPNKNNTNWDNRPSTLRFAILVNNAPRTVGKVDCIMPEGSTSATLKPSCSDYSYPDCKCSGISCSDCTLASSHLSKLLYLGDTMQLYASGYTSQNDKPYVPTLLQIKTADVSTQYYMEIIPLPALPLQKWTVVTIVKEGRRIDVYYGSVVVASHLCNRIPVPQSSSDSWKAGNAAWKGQIGLFTNKISASTTDDVNTDVSALVNTRGIPFYLEQMNFDFNIPQLPCLTGNCNPLPTVKPLNPFAAYVTNVQ